MALVEDPKLAIITQHFQNHTSGMKSEQRLAEINPDWKDLVKDSTQAERSYSDKPYDPDVSKYLNPPIRVPDIDPILAKVGASKNITELLDCRQQLLHARADLKRAFNDEEELDKADEARAAGRRFDYGPFIRKWLQLMIQNGTLREVIEEEKEVAEAKSKGKAKGKKGKK